MSQSHQNAFLLQCFGLRDSPKEEGGADAEETVAGVEHSQEESSGEGGARPVFGARPRLQFSERQPPPQFLPDGTENVEWARYQSAQRLRNKWEGIYDRFKDAHLEDQDEIYLGRASIEGDEPRIIRDRGSLRALEKQLWFGSFIRDEDLELFDEDAGASSLLSAPAVAVPPPAAQRDGETEMDEFLRQEARRRELYGDDEELDDTAPCLWDEVETPSAPRPKPAVREEPNLALELDIYRSVKREAIETLLQNGRLGRSDLPFTIPGLDRMTTQLYTHESK